MSYRPIHYVNTSVIYIYFGLLATIYAAHFKNNWIRSNRNFDRPVKIEWCHGTRVNAAHKDRLCCTILSVSGATGRIRCCKGGSYGPPLTGLHPEVYPAVDDELLITVREL